MKSTFLYLALALAGAAVAENVTVTEDLTSTGDWEVTVAEGVTNYVTGVQSGSGKIIKKGGGNLVLAAANTFSGGVVIDEGVVEPAHSSAFGTGTITLNADGEKVCQVRFTTGQLTFANDLQVNGTTSISQPAFYFAAGTNVWNGAISAANDLHLLDDGAWAYISTGGTITWNGTSWVCSGSKWSTKVNCIPIMSFNGDVTVSSGDIYLVPDGTFDFRGKVTCQVFDNSFQTGLFTYHDQNEFNFYGVINFRHANDIGELRLGYRSPIACVDGALDGTRIKWVFYDSANSRDSANLTAMEGTTQRFASFETLLIPSGRICCNLLGGRATNPAQVFVTGKGLPPDSSYCSGMCIGKSSSTATRYLNFALDGDASCPGFTQTLSNRSHRMVGALGVTNGTLRLVAGTAFSNVTAVAVGLNGKLFCDSTCGGLFTSAESLALAGELEIAAAREWPFSNKLKALALSDGARLTLPEGVLTTLEVERLTVNGAPQQCGVVQAADLPSGIHLPTGLSVVVTEPLPATGTAVWTGAAEADDLMTTPANWELPAGGLDIESGLMAVTVAAGATNMVPGEGRSCVHSIKGTACTPTADSQPFVLGAHGKRLEIAAAVQFVGAGQVVLRGEIVPPGEADQGEPSDKGDKTFYYQAKDTKTLGFYPSAYYKGVYGYSVPLVLDGVTMGKPYYSYYAANAGDDVLYATAGSTNIFTGEVCFTAGAWTAWTLEQDALVEFRGGARSGARVYKTGPGIVKITGKAWRTGSNGFTVGEGGLILDAEGCDFNESSPGKGLDIKDGKTVSVEFKRSYCFKDITHQMEVVGAGVKTVEFNCTTQRVAQFYGGATGKNSYLHGTYPAMLEIYGGCRPKSALSSCAGMTNKIQVTGGLGFHMVGSGVNNGVANVLSGADATFVLKGKNFASAGDLEVSGGTLMLDSDATWRNGTNVTVRGTGTFIFNGARQLNGNVARLHLSDSGKVTLAGGNQKVASAEVCVEGVWQEVPPGTYTASSSGIMAGRLTGEYTLRVGAVGTALLIR